EQGHGKRIGGLVEKDSAKPVGQFGARAWLHVVVALEKRPKDGTVRRGTGRKLVRREGEFVAREMLDLLGHLYGELGNPFANDQRPGGQVADTLEPGSDQHQDAPQNVKER